MRLLSMIVFLVSVLSFVLSAAGLVLVGAQAWMVRRFFRRQPRHPTRPLPGISILKPLCGLDDGLADNLRSFITLDYPDYEVLLGFRSATDAAFPLAREFADRYPQRFRIVFQVGEPGLNPKVNQLITLARSARHDLLLVSDASARALPGYLPEIAACFEDPEVALVTHPLVGVGEARLGSLCDNLYITSHISAGPIAAKEVQDQDIVVGKSMAFRRGDLDAMGGFTAAKDYLAEDYVMGRWTKSVLGKRVVIARTPVLTVSVGRSLAQYLERFERWAVMQRKAVGIVIYEVQTLMFPTLYALFGYLLFPSWKAFTLLVAITCCKMALDTIQLRIMRPGGFPLRKALAIPLADLLAGWAWVHGLHHDRVEWRGNLLEVTEGTRLIPLGAGSPWLAQEGLEVRNASADN